MAQQRLGEQSVEIVCKGKQHDQKTEHGQYDAQQALNMGLVNEVVPLDALEETGVGWAREILLSSPTAIRCLKASLNADCDGQSGLQELAGNATMLFYMSEEGQEGRDAYLEKRPPDFSRFPWLP